MSETRLSALARGALLIGLAAALLASATIASVLVWAAAVGLSHVAAWLAG